VAGKTFQFRLITPQGKIIDAAASYASLPAHDGALGVLPERAPMVIKLGLGELQITCAEDTGTKGEGTLRHVAAGGTRTFLVEEGFAQMAANRLTILTTRAIPAETLTESDATAEFNEAEARKPASPADSAKITRDRQRARLKLRLARGRAGKGI
jgi:F-type H+-transporting ATPase subunit epsilon